jgi:ferredoxin-NADP reductase
VITARLVDAIPTTPRTRRLRLELLKGPFAFTAGQAVYVGVAGSGQQAPYSIASAPALAAAGTLELLVSAVGAFGQAALNPATIVGRLLEVEGPVGTFGVPLAAERRPLLLVAGGTGIAPLRSVVLDRLEPAHAAPISLVYSARAVDEFAFGAEFEALAEAGRLALHCTVTRDDPTPWPGRTGRIDERLLTAAWPGDGTWSLVCGPGPFVSDVTTALARMGVDPARVVVER